MVLMSDSIMKKYLKSIEDFWLSKLSQAYTLGKEEGKKEVIADSIVPIKYNDNYFIVKNGVVYISESNSIEGNWKPLTITNPKTEE